MAKYESAKKYYEAKFENCETTKDFLEAVADEVNVFYDIIDERYEADEDADVTDCEKVIESIEDNATFRNMEYKLLKEFVDSSNADEVFWIEPMKKDNLEGLKKQLWESCLGYSDAYTDEEVAREEAMINDFNEIKTMKSLRKWLKDYDIEGYYGLKIWKKYLVDAMNY